LTHPYRKSSQKEDSVKAILLAVFCAFAMLLQSNAAVAQQKLVSDPEIYEKDHARSQCEAVEYGADFVKRLDINNDGLTDLVTNRGELTCDGVKGRSCDDEGCLNNFYVQVKEGGYLLIATARVYSYEFIQRFGNMVFQMKMHPRYCDRSDDRACEMTVRVRGTKFVTIAKK
jgi:hypothetical protein